MDFKKRKENSRPGRARSAEGRNSQRGYKSRSSQEHREGRDDKPFSRRKSSDNDGYKSERRDKFNKEAGNDRPFRERRSYKKEDGSKGFEKRPRFKRDSYNNENRSVRTFKRRVDGDSERTERSGDFTRKTDYGKDRDGRSTGFNKNRRERPSGFGNDREERSSGRPERSGGFEKRSYNSREKREGSYEGKRSFKKGFSERGESQRRSFSGERPYKKENASDYRSAGTRENRFRSGIRNRKPEGRNFTLSPENGDGLIRLNRFIAASGICSRREADDLIKAGLVTVNGKVISEMGVKVSPKDEVRYNGELIKSEKLVYILLNKPKDYVTTSKDPYAKQTVLDLLKGAGPERVFPVGRLDRNTTGVLLLTNDGDLTKKLTHPSFNKKKIYQVTLDKNLKPEHFNAIAEGLELEDGFIKVDAVDYIYPEDKKQVGVEIHSGKNHIVRRIFEHFGYRVSKLDRVYFAGLTKKNLKRGEWRYLTSQETGMLKMGSFE